MEQGKREPLVHRMKCRTEYFLQVCAGRKQFELRKDDRNVQTGDTVILMEWEPECGYTGAVSRQLHISYVLRDKPEHGLQTGYCIICWDN